MTTQMILALRQIAANTGIWVGLLSEDQGLVDTLYAAIRNSKELVSAGTEYVLENY